VEEGKEKGGRGKERGGRGRDWAAPLPCPLTQSCPPNAEFLDPPMAADSGQTPVVTSANGELSVQW